MGDPDLRRQLSLGIPIAVDRTTDTAYVGDADAIHAAICASTDEENEWVSGVVSGFLTDVYPFRVSVEDRHGSKAAAFVCVRHSWRVRFAEAQAQATRAQQAGRATAGNCSTDFAEEKIVAQDAPT